MKTVIRHIGVLKAGLILAVLYGFISLILVVIAAAVLLFNPKEALPLLLLAILYPVIGFVGGVLMAALYNLAAMVMGGLEITLESKEPPTCGEMPPLT